nr:hypothetical protein [Desulfallas sp. Bu1-1]
MLFDKERYRLAKRILQNGGFVYENSLALDKVEYLRGRGIVFPGSVDGKKILTMPLEILEVFREMDTPELKKVVNRNTEWIRLTHGMLYYYGVKPAPRWEEMTPFPAAAARSIKNAVESDHAYKLIQRRANITARPRVMVAMTLRVL